MTTCNREEAVYYMEMCDFHIDAAIKEWKADTEWAQSTEKKALVSNTTKHFSHNREDKIKGPSMAAVGRKQRTCC